jgi:nucleotide-binding universal stress UspA family protein
VASQREHKRILLATDGSQDSVAAAAMLPRLRLANNNEIGVLTVVHRLNSTGFGMAVTQLASAITDEEAREAQSFVNGIAESLRPYYEGAQAWVREGSPAEEIMELARAWDADLVVVGSRGHSALEAFLLGSVSQKAAMYAPCSVLVVRSGVSNGFLSAESDYHCRGGGVSN